MNIGELSVRYKVVAWLFVIILVGGGIAGFDAMFEYAERILQQLQFPPVDHAIFLFPLPRSLP